MVAHGERRAVGRTTVVGLRGTVRRGLAYMLTATLPAANGRRTTLTAKLVAR